MGQCLFKEFKEKNRESRVILMSGSHFSKIFGMLTILCRLPGLKNYVVFSFNHISNFSGLKDREFARNVLGLILRSSNYFRNKIVSK